jgi:hypothetical protein
MRAMNVDLNELEERAEAVAERLQAFGRYL